MPRIVRVTLIIWFTSFSFAMGTFLGAHGGFKGEIHYIFEYDYHAGEEENILFNRWYMEARYKSILHFVRSSYEPRGVRFFVAINIPAYYAGKVLYGILQILPQFRQKTPFGYSALSYHVLFMLLISPIQWFLLGKLLAWLLYKIGWKSDWTYIEPSSTNSPA